MDQVRISLKISPYYQSIFMAFFIVLSSTIAHPSFLTVIIMLRNCTYSRTTTSSTASLIETNPSTLTDHQVDEYLDTLSFEDLEEEDTSYSTATRL